MNELLLALLPAFVAGLAVQQALELASPVVDRMIAEKNKKIVLNLAAFAVGVVLAVAGGLRVLAQVVEGEPTAGTAAAAFVCADVLVTALIVSGGTETFNSVLKFLGYAKEEKKAEVKATAEATKASTLAADDALGANGGQKLGGSVR